LVVGYKNDLTVFRRSFPNGGGMYEDEHIVPEKQILDWHDGIVVIKLTDT
jgi:hypothetical protein